jgi:hypothetical protein
VAPARSVRVRRGVSREPTLALRVHVRHARLVVIVHVVEILHRGAERARRRATNAARAARFEVAETQLYFLQSRTIVDDMRADIFYFRKVAS